VAIPFAIVVLSNIPFFQAASTSIPLPSEPTPSSTPSSDSRPAPIIPPVLKENEPTSDSVSTDGLAQNDAADSDAEPLQKSKRHHHRHRRHRSPEVQ